MTKKVLIGAKNGSLAKYSDILRRAGYEVTSAGSETEFFNSYRGQYDVILFDLSLGIRNLPKIALGKATVVALGSDSGYRGFAKEWGAHNFVLIPLLRDVDLESAVQEAVSAAEERTLASA